jgi:pimeloyl-ACP methyl ester carboxylesterase
LVFIGGLTSGPQTAPQMERLVEALQDDPDLSCSFWEFRMRSSYTGFGHSSLAYDAEDIAALVKYLKDLGKERIVLLGSSTGMFIVVDYWAQGKANEILLGCQGILTYATLNDDNPVVSAYILQAPTSDRETAGLLMPPDFYATTLKHAEDMIARGERDEIMPRALIPPIFSSPITAYRWHSLITKGGDDDFFSSDLDDETLAKTFGNLRRPTLIMPSENDEMVPQTIEKRVLLQRWTHAAPGGMVSDLSGLNPGADHALSEDGPQRWFVERVVDFVKQQNA